MGKNGVCCYCSPLAFSHVLLFLVISRHLRRVYVSTCGHDTRTRHPSMTTRAIAIVHRCNGYACKKCTHGSTCKRVASVFAYIRSRVTRQTMPPYIDIKATHAIFRAAFKTPGGRGGGDVPRAPPGTPRGRAKNQGIKYKNCKKRKKCNFFLQNICTCQFFFVPLYHGTKQ